MENTIKNNSVVDSVDSEVDCEFKYWVYHFLALYLWPKYINFLCFVFFNN